MWEIEVALVFGRIVEARAEISNRLFELNHLPGLHAKERLAISEAMVCLRSLEREDQRHKAAEIGKVVLEKVRSISARFAPQASEPEQCPSERCPHG
jgi:4-aminobutyrate aminotransferase-like enzyme